MKAPCSAALALLVALPGCGGKVLHHVPSAETDASVPPSPFGGCTAPMITVARGGPLHGTIAGWVEASGQLAFSATGVRFPTGGSSAEGRAYWSIGMLSSDGTAGSADFTSANLANIDLASAPSVAHIDQITDATVLPRATFDTPPVLQGEFVVYHYEPMNVFMGLRVDHINGVATSEGCQHDSVGNFTFYIVADGTADFSGFKGL